MIYYTAHNINLRTFITFVVPCNQFRMVQSLGDMQDRIGVFSSFFNFPSYYIDTYFSTSQYDLKLLTGMQIINLYKNIFIFHHFMNCFKIAMGCPNVTNEF